ncbi:MAG: hypothetical protein IPG66_15515 [Hydrogenophilales bacterium]|nr:hypothetical protein [Hydrogenophilales bacterium]
MTLAALIRKSATVRLATATPATVATLEGDNARTVANVATFSVANAPETKTATASRWWLVHYLDGAPVEVWTSPPATHADILERHPEAIAAEPINQAEPKTARACSTCTHVTGRGGCGEPLAAGLSDLTGVICYSPDLGETCPAWLAIIPGDLEARILMMAERWNYSGDDLATALFGTRSDPNGWWRVVEVDENEGGE